MNWTADQRRIIFLSSRRQLDLARYDGIRQMREPCTESGMLVYRLRQRIMKDCCRIQLITSDYLACIKGPVSIVKFIFIVVVLVSVGQASHAAVNTLAIAEYASDSRNTNHNSKKAAIQMHLGIILQSTFSVAPNTGL
ncbi:hypothetical protein N431DRAFT_49888 [Stipitochalara longipes BDJ]|nr:hypothetical protein N431DRAFT_49888 [Stipitochalara longipes BDJ]